jgi:hypothetical protein
LKEWLGRIESRCKSRGPDEAATFFKEVHQIAINIAVGKKFEPLKWCRSTRDGVPSILQPIVPYLRNETPTLKRIGLTLTRLYTRIVSQTEVNLGSIINPGPSIPHDITAEFREYLIRYNPFSEVEAPEDWT